MTCGGAPVDSVPLQGIPYLSNALETRRVSAPSSEGTLPFARLVRLTLTFSLSNFCPLRPLGLPNSS